MFDAICDHIKYATTDGTIKPTITIFRQRQFNKPDLRVWNGMGLGYAGYEIEADIDMDDEEADDNHAIPGSRKVKKIGDQASLEFTEVIQGFP